MIKVAIVDRRIPKECERNLFLRGFHVITLPPSDKLGEAVASHTDMLLAKLGNELITSAEYCEVALPTLSEIYDYTRMNMHFTDDSFMPSYPNDVLFNILVMGRRVYMREESISPYLKDLVIKRGYEIRNVSQGYPACTVLKLSDESVITADAGMAKALMADGIRVYKICEGGISLSPYKFGFIGGAGGVCDGAVYFFGDMTKHPEWNIIKECLIREGLMPVMLGGGTPIDLGGIIFADVYDQR